MKLMSFENFAKKIDVEIIFYVIVTCSTFLKFTKINVNVVFAIKIHSFESFIQIFEKYKDFKNLFTKKNVASLTFHWNCDHVIDIKNEIFFFDLLYNLSITKFKMLRKYIDDALTKNWIKHFINSTKALMFFVSKKNENFTMK